MKVFRTLYDRLSTDIAKFYVGAIAVVVTSIFAFVQWGLPLYWERLPNFEMSFSEVAKNRYIQAEPLAGEAEQCLISGSIKISNNSKSPLFLNNTYLYLIPYKVTRCEITDEICLSSQNDPPKVLTNDKELVDLSFQELSVFHRHKIQPIVRDHDLFSGGTGSRPFSLLVPTEQVINERMIVLAQQEYGNKSCVALDQKKGWNQSFCKTSRTQINVSWPCIVPSYEFKEMRSE